MNRRDETDGIDAIASALFAAIEAGDLDAVRDLYAPDVEVWHNVGGRTQSREENLALLQAFANRVSERRYEVQGRDHFPGGFVQRHLLHGRLADGSALALPACVVVYVVEGRIRRLFEYLDAAAVGPVFTD